MRPGKITQLEAADAGILSIMARAIDYFALTRRGCGLVVSALAALVVTMAGAVQAQTAPRASGSGVSYIAPFPAGDVYKLQVYGDTFADDLLQSLGEVLGDAEQVEVAHKPRAISSLIRAECEDDIRTEEQSHDVVHIGVLTIGLNDRGALRLPGGKSAGFGTPAWSEQYGQRLDRLLKALKRRNIALYVVSVPPLRRSDANADAAIINETLLERSLSNGLRFIDVAESFSDEAGDFTQFGLDQAGNRNKLRDADGIGFTPAGSRKLAALVATEIKRDLVAARAERSVPLAGGESEQRRINPDKAATVPVVPEPKSIAGENTRGGRPQTASQSSGAAGAALLQPPAAPTNQGGLKAETSQLMLRFQSIAGRDETSQQVEIVRPAVPASVIALLTRKETVEAAQPAFDLLIDDVGDGVSVATMVTATAEGNAPGGRRRGPNVLAAFTAVWVKGERLMPKPGRADDFSWPRVDVFAGSEPAAPVAGPQRFRHTPLPSARH